MCRPINGQWYGASTPGARGDPGTGLPRLVCTVGAGGQANRERGSWRASLHLYGQTGMVALVGRLRSILAKGEGLQGWGVGARSPHAVLGQSGIRSGYGEVAGNHHHAPLQGSSWCHTQEETQVWPWGGSVLYLSSPLQLSPYKASGPIHQRRMWKRPGLLPRGTVLLSLPPRMALCGATGTELWLSFPPQ